MPHRAWLQPGIATKWPTNAGSCRVRSIKVIAAMFLACRLFTASPVVQAQENESQSAPPKTEPAQTQDSAQKKDAQKKEKRGEWLIAPIPISSPAIGSGLQWAVGYVFPFSKQDKVSPDSVVGIGGLVTNNGSHGAALGGRIYLKQDKYRFAVGGGDAKINADIYGIGKLAGDNGFFLPLTTEGTAAIVESLFKFGKDLYIGPRFNYRNLSLAINSEKVDIPDINNPPENLKPIIDQIKEDLFHQRTVSIGPRFVWDSRDNVYSAQKGLFLDSGIDLFMTGLGSKYTYQYYKVAFNKYTSLSKLQVIAFRAMGCAVAGDHVPIYDLCLFGTSNDLRGYTAGRYQDRRMFATQAEYRLTMPPKKLLGRFGIVAFAGFGGIGHKFSDIGFSDLLPSGGGGVRFRLTKENPINFRVDYGVGIEGQHTLSVGVLEAF